MAIRLGDSEYVLLLNPDTIVGEDVIKDAISFMDSHDRAGGMGVHMLNPDGSSAMESRRGFPTLSSAFYKFTGLCARFPHNHKFGKYYMGYLPWDEPAKIEVVSGALFMLRRKALDKIGLLDESYFMYGEDVDLSYRLIKGGFENWYLPVKVLHYKGESTRRSSFKHVLVFHQAMITFVSKHYYGMSSWLKVPIKITIYLKVGVGTAHVYMRKLFDTVGFGGLFHHEKRKKYVFIGSEESIKACKRIADVQALVADFIVGDEESLPNGHLEMSLIGADTYIIVYDVNAYSFSSILNIFSSQSCHDVSIGTFDIQAGVVITKDSILRR